MAYSGDEFEKKMKDVDRYVDSIVGKLELSSSDALLFFSMATAVSTYYAGYILEDTKEMVQSLFNFSLFIDREPKYGGPTVINLQIPIAGSLSVQIHLNFNLCNYSFKKGDVYILHR